MISKFKHLFKKTNIQLKPVEFEQGSDTIVFSGIIYHNDYINICHDTCSICYNKDGSWRNLDDRRTYIENKIKVGHESILQHSVVLIQISMEKSDNNLEFIYKNIATAFDGVRNKHLLYYIKNTDKSIDVYVKGSILAIKNYIRYSHETNNLIYKGIKNSLYELDKCVLWDFIRDNILSDFKFIPNYEANIETYQNEFKPLYQGKYIDLLGSNENYIISLCLDLDLPNVETLEISSVTVLFKRIPRVISQMVTRHDNAITQLSQRYTDCSDTEFIVPADIEETTTMAVNINGQSVMMSALELGNFISDFYKQLLESGYRKEQARAYLPNNINTQLYVTFTLKNLVHFLQLRTHKSAQIDIVVIAKEIEKASKDVFGSWIDYDLIKPVYEVMGQQLEEKLNIDEPMGRIKEEVK